MATDTQARGSARADAWVWAVRVTATRTLASDKCKAGHIRVNGERAKPSTPVRVGDTVEVKGGERLRVLEVRQLLVKRVSAEVAAAAYIDRSPPPPPRELSSPVGIRDRGSGKPAKKERRQLDRLRGRSSRG